MCFLVNIELGRAPTKMLIFFPKGKEGEWGKGWGNKKTCSLSFQDCYDLIAAESEQTHLWPFGPIYGQSDAKKFCAPLRGAVFITHFAKKLLGREKYTTVWCGSIALSHFFSKNVTRQYLDY